MKINLDSYSKKNLAPEVFYGLPEKVDFCSKCVISNQRPSSAIEFLNKFDLPKKTINFDENKVCDACKFNEIKNNKIDWELRENKLIELLEKYRKNDGNYDVVVPGSGGKDSAYTAHILKYKYGMNPLTVTWAPHEYTPIGWKNFQNWIKKGGLDNILLTPNGKLHRYLTKLAFQNLLHPFQPFIIGQKIIGPRIATKYDVKLIMYGENQAEYGNDLNENMNSSMQPIFYTFNSEEDTYFGGHTLKNILSTTNFKLADFQPYLGLDSKELDRTEIEVKYLSYYLKWDPQECYYYAAENCGFEANELRTQGTYSRYASIDDKLDYLHFYTTLIKFGIGRATYDACQEIRNGKITRDEGVRLVRKYDTEFPSNYFSDLIEYLDISEKEFFETVDKFRSPHIWYKENSEWKLRHQVE